MKAGQKILIIKTGESETFVPHEVEKPGISIGDVVRSSVLLDQFNNDEITLVTSRKCTDLFNGIDEKVHCISKEQLEEIDYTSFDICVNLEKGFFSIVHKFKKTVGFINQSELRLWNGVQVKLEEFILELKKDGVYKWSDWLFYLIGQRNECEMYCISRPYVKRSEVFDVALNWQVGHKWPTKKLPYKSWQQIEKRCLAEDINVQMQPPPTSLIAYMEWIARAKVVVTTDSLGLHLALAYGKKVVCFFGATPADQHSLSSETIKLNLDVPKTYNCLPCFSSICYQAKLCTEFLEPSTVFKAIKKQLNKK